MSQNEVLGCPGGCQGTGYLVYWKKPSSGPICEVCNGKGYIEPGTEEYKRALLAQCLDALEGADTLSAKCAREMIHMETRTLRKDLPSLRNGILFITVEKAK
jgi:hypothetical protein